LPVFAGFFCGFFHCPGKNTFCRGKNPTLTMELLNNRYAFYMLGRAESPSPDRFMDF